MAAALKPAWRGAMRSLYGRSLRSWSSLLAPLAVWWWLVGPQRRNVTPNCSVVSDFQSAKRLLDGINRRACGRHRPDRQGRHDPICQPGVRAYGWAFPTKLVGMDCAAILAMTPPCGCISGWTWPSKASSLFMFKKDVMWAASRRSHYPDHVLAITATSSVITKTVSGVPRHHAACRCAGAQPAYGPADHRRVHARHRGRRPVFGRPVLVYGEPGRRFGPPSASARKTSTVRTGASLSRIGKMQLPRSCPSPHAGRRQAMERHGNMPGRP